MKTGSIRAVLTAAIASLALATAAEAELRLDSEGNVFATGFLQICDNGVPFYRDGDNDGFGDPAVVVTACGAMGYVRNSDDCDDSDREKRPGAEITDAKCEDGVDNDCDTYVDCVDFDCGCALACGGSGCACPPEADVAACIDGVDNDCDGYTDCIDFDCAGIGSCPPR